jgi:hypothetical protein
VKSWEVKLKGDSLFLNELSKEYCSPELCIKAREEEYFLTSNNFSQFSDESELYLKGIELIEFINASSKIFSYKHKPIESDGFWSIDEGIRKNEFIAIGDSTLFFTQVVCKNDPASAPKEWYQIWEEQDRVKYVFRLFDSNSPLDWFSLFMIYETIRDDPMHSDIPKKVRDTGIKKIKDSSSESKNESFRNTANWYRHSSFGKKQNGKNHTKPEIEMTLLEGNNLIRDLINMWMEWKLKMI